MLKRIERTIHERDLIRPGMKVVAGVSGGADSVALLYALWFLRHRLHFQLSAAHLHHGLRGKDADLDARLVEQLCLRLGIPCRIEKEAVRRTRKRSGVSLEMAAREARLDFFRRALVESSGDVVAVAHHRDDQAETVLMRLLTGGGIEGLGGMDYQSSPLPELTVIRPLLDVPKSDIRAFLQRHRLSWREDRSNQCPAMLRNRLRLRLLPGLVRAGFPGLVDALNRIADQLREEQKVLEQQTGDLLRAAGGASSAKRLRRSHWRQWNIAEQRRVLRRWLAQHGLSGRSLDFDRIERIRRAVDATKTGVMALNATTRLLWTRQALAIEPLNPPLPRTIPMTLLRVPGRTPLPDQGLEVLIAPTQGFQRIKGRVGRLPAVAFVKREPGKLPAFAIRSRRAGDRIEPTGMTGSVSLKELFINAKVPLARRLQVPVLVAGDEVVWVAGYRVARSWEVPSAQSPSWKVTVAR